jgi:hypothetical protein
MFENATNDLASPMHSSTTCVVVGRSVTVTRVAQSRWSVEVDQHALDGTFASAGEAWLAGVREVDRLRVAAG